NSLSSAVRPGGDGWQHDEIVGTIWRCGNVRYCRETACGARLRRAAGGCPMNVEAAKAPDGAAANRREPLLKVQGLEVEFSSSAGRLRAVDGLDLHVAPGETLAIVGESGSGKSVSALSIMRLLPGRIARIANGR